MARQPRRYSQVAVMARADGYDPDERGRYDGDEPWQMPVRNPEWDAIVMAQEAAKIAAYEEHQRAYYAAPRPICPTERYCPDCHGTGMVRAHPEMTTTCACPRCDGIGYLA